MTLTTAMWAALAAIAIGAAAVWTNPRRGLNIMLSVASLHVALWLFSVHLLCIHGFSAGWLRASCVLMALLPVHGWLIRSAILQPGLRLGERLWRGRGCFAVSVGMAVWAASPLLVPYHTTGELDHLRPEQLVFPGIAVLATQVFGLQSMSALGGRPGIRRIETQVLMMGMSTGALATAVLCSVAGFLHEASILELMPLAVAASLALTVWALTSIQIHDARYIVASVTERVALVVLVVVFVWAVQQLMVQFVQELTAYVVSLALGLWGAAEVHPWLRAVFRRRSRSSRIRREIHEVARKELRPEEMEDAFVRVIKGGTHSEKVVILMRTHSRLTGAGLDIPVDDPAMKALHATGWVTPERLERERSSPEREPLRALMEAQGFGLMIANAGPSIAFVLAVGVPVDQHPFTRPDIFRLIDVAATLENSLSRAHFLRQAQQAEQLTTVGLLGASIAHEIRNPLVSIKTFVQLLPDHYQEAAFRDKFFRLIGDEVGRIDRLTEQLLDLASPRVFSARAVELNPVLKGCLDLIAAKAEDKGVRLIIDFRATPDVVQIDPNAVKQVVLNLCFNAIQAQENVKGERWIRVETSQVSGSVEVAVSDNGPGLTPEVWGRLFQPFQSTKSSGFGLGLAICKDILSSIHATIIADPPAPGRGATFRITIPCPPPTS